MAYKRYTANRPCHLQSSYDKNPSVLRTLSGLTLASLLSAPVIAAPREVRVYSGRHYNTDRQVFKAFNQKTGIRVRLIEATGISLIERLKREGSKSKADVILLVDAARINNAANEGLLQPIDSPKLQNDVPINYRDPSNRWFGLTRRVRSIIANPNKVNVDAIKTYADLAKPEFKGQLCLRKRNNVYNQSLVADQIILKGPAEAKAWIAGMIKNVSKPFYSGDVSLIRAVGQGRCGISIVNHYYFARMQDGASGQKDQKTTRSVQLITPDPAHVNISAAGMARSAQNKQEAIELIHYLASPEGSRALSGPTYEYPLTDSTPTQALRGLGSFNPDGVSIAELGKAQKTAVRLMADSGWQ